MIHCSKDIMDWGVDRSGQQFPRQPFFNTLSCDKNIVIVLLLLTGAVCDTHRYVTNHLKRFLEFEWLWKQEPEEEYERFNSVRRSPDEYIEKLKEIVEVETKIDNIPMVETIAAFNLRTE